MQESLRHNDSSDDSSVAVVTPRVLKLTNKTSVTARKKTKNVPSSQESSPTSKNHQQLLDLCKQLELDCAGYLSENKKLKKELDELHKKADSLSFKLEVLKVQKTSLEDSKKSLKEQLKAAASASKSVATAEKNAAESKLDKEMNKNATLQLTITSLTDDKDKLKREVAAQAKKISSLQHHISKQAAHKQALENIREKKQWKVSASWTFL